MRRPAVALLLAVLGACSADRGSSKPLLEVGRQSYARNCAPCHGERGDGAGPAARLQVRRPRSFVSDPFLTTGSNALPSDAQLLRVVTDGLPHSAMPSFASLPEDERRALVLYVKTFFDKRATR
jgi:mono/diheme cytochrome c family protein